jgi:hypothetical protein
MNLELTLLFLLLTSSSAIGWLSVQNAAGPSVNVFTLNDDGTQGKAVLSFPIKNGEIVRNNAMACGRCFCLILGTNANTQTSTLYNMSFCLVPTPTLESQVSLPGYAYNLHSNEGEGDGGNGYTILETTKNKVTSYEVVKVSGANIIREIDISEYVNLFQGNVYPGSTAFCAETSTMWVAIQTTNPLQDTLLTLNLATKSVIANISITKPALTGHFADCSSNLVGGVTIKNVAGVNNVQFGMLSPAGAFTVLDQIALPKGSTAHLAGIADFLHMPKWNPFEYGTILYAGGPGDQLPGMLVTSKGQMGSGQMAPLSTVVSSVSVEY